MNESRLPRQLLLRCSTTVLPWTYAPAASGERRLHSTAWVNPDPSGAACYAQSPNRGQRVACDSRAISVFRQENKQRLPARSYSRSRRERLTTAVLIAVMHILPITVLITGTDRIDWILFAVIYPFQAIGVGICLHRYFAHNAFSTSRGFQFLLALFCASTFGDPVRFAGKHRLHHLHTDRPDDPHTPLHGFWSSWFGSHLDSRYSDAELLAQVSNLTKYPELMWLHRNSLVPGLTLCLIALLIGGISGMAIGVLLGASILVHQSSAVNYICHKYGRRRFDTDDCSTNHFLVSLLVFGEGWHNNHHRYPVSARAGFCWWEIDMFYWVICLFERLGLVWDVKRPPEILRLTKLRPGRA